MIFHVIVLDPQFQIIIKNLYTKKINNKNTFYSGSYNGKGKAKI